MARHAGFVQTMRLVYNPIGFKKGYNFVLFFITVGYLFGFTLSRLQYFSFGGVFCKPDGKGLNHAIPAECYYYTRDPYKLGIKLHLFTILPAALLVCFQFVPILRHKVIIFHRLNGYLVILLSTIASAGALMIARHAVGGDMATQTYIGALVISTTLAYLMAWINIKRLQIDQHRAWMLRAWTYFATIITLRIIMIIGVSIISTLSGWYAARSCVEVDSTFGRKNTIHFWPECESYYNGTNLEQFVVVQANRNGKAIEVAAAFGFNFGSSGWLAFWLHAIGVELYLRLTPAESDRLRQVSYERQLERGFKHPGSAGLTAERFGDARPYHPSSATHDVDTEDVPMKDFDRREG
ncbi:hypothetical protein LTR95_001323 [Oleoguttula sp. CCFEE 5521]